MLNATISVSLSYAALKRMDIPLNQIELDLEDYSDKSELILENELEIINTQQKKKKREQQKKQKEDHLKKLLKDKASNKK